MEIAKVLNKVALSRRDRMIAGVCGGFAEATGSPSWVWRAGFVFAAVLGGSGLLAYVVLWAFMPQPGDAG